VTVVLEDTFTIYSDNLCWLYICAHVVLGKNLLDKLIGNSWQAGNSQIRGFPNYFIQNISPKLPKTNFFQPVCQLVISTNNPLV
jgi:hypothetical protein